MANGHTGAIVSLEYFIFAVGSFIYMRPGRDLEMKMFTSSKQVSEATLVVAECNEPLSYRMPAER
jgi:hypothetical protein